MQIYSGKIIEYCLAYMIKANTGKTSIYFVDSYYIYYINININICSKELK